ncbi:MAG TPA: type II toxin-antitoxin system ParD family antitoxin [Blastocatellia bacterium]|nr:type II toxin-antitoxin system ParD family antitoxin [Blastocatellia bacterium]
MIIELKPEDELIIQRRLQSGAFNSVDDIIHRALESLEADEEWMAQNKESINEKISRGLAQLDRGEGLSPEESRTQFEEKKTAWTKQQQG